MRLANLHHFLTYTFSF